MSIMLHATLQTSRSTRNPRLVIVGLLMLATMMAIVSLIFRGYYSGHKLYFFLFKDLFLAWVPMGLSFALAAFARRFTRRPLDIALLLGLAVAWVLFLPNAPYLLTEFLHLTPHQAPNNMQSFSLFPDAGNGSMPAWYDVFMILLFAWNGLLLTVLSVRSIQQVVRERLGAAWGWAATIALLLLSGFGVTLGRFERFNSWDIVTRPARLLADTAARVFEPFSHPRTTGATLLLSAFLIVAYLTLVAMMNLRDSDPLTSR